MKHCPNGGTTHKDYYVRVSPQVVQCMYEGCNRPFMSVLTEKDKDWKLWLGAKKLDLPTPMENTLAAGAVDRLLDRVLFGAPGTIIEFNTNPGLRVQERMARETWVTTTTNAQTVTNNGEIEQNQ